MGIKSRSKPGLPSVDKMKVSPTLSIISVIRPSKITFYKSFTDGPKPFYTYIEGKKNDDEFLSTHEGFVSTSEALVSYCFDGEQFCTNNYQTKTNYVFSL